MPLVHALVLLDAESSGGLNIFGKPKKPCGQPHRSPVTPESYAAYLARRDECQSQGVGILQLTWPATQDEADRRGGCWDPHIQAQVGLEQFADLLARYGVEGAFSAWNTGKPGETPYAAKAMGMVDGWQRVING